MAHDHRRSGVVSFGNLSVSMPTEYVCSATLSTQPNPAQPNPTQLNQTKPNQTKPNRTQQRQYVGIRRW